MCISHVNHFSTSSSHVLSSVRCVLASHPKMGNEVRTKRSLPWTRQLFLSTTLADLQ